MRNLVDAGVRTDWTLHGRSTRDWHLARFWDHIINRSSVNRVGHPYTSYPSDTLHYSTDSWPATTAILERALMLNIPGLASVLAPEDVARLLRQSVERAHAF